MSLTGEPEAGTADKVSDLSAAGSTANDCTGDTGGDRQQHIRRIELAHTLRRRGVETKLVLTAPSQNAPPTAVSSQLSPRPMTGSGN